MPRGEKLKWRLLVFIKNKILMKDLIIWIAHVRFSKKTSRAAFSGWQEILRLLLSMAGIASQGLRDTIRIALWMEREKLQQQQRLVYRIRPFRGFRKDLYALLSGQQVKWF
jgi:hypothetical protein